MSLGFSAFFIAFLKQCVLDLHNSPQKEHYWQVTLTAHMYDRLHWIN